MQKVKAKKTAKLKLEKNGRISVNESDVGYIEFDSDKKLNKQSIINFFKKDDQRAVEMINEMRMPKEFTFVWISKIYIKQSKRGKGFGTKIIKMLENKYRNHTLVLGLSPGKLVPTTDIDKLIPFYEDSGFKIVDSKKAYYAFKVIKRRSVQ